MLGKGKGKGKRAQLRYQPLAGMVEHHVETRWYRASSRAA